MTLTVARLLEQGRTMLASMDEPRLEAALLLGKVLHCSREHLMTWPEQPVDDQASDQFLTLVDRRLAGEPVAYILGYRAFWSLDLMVNEHVLIPRPETELLVETILEKFGDHASLEVADLGTGSGAIALALAAERPGWRITASDVSEASLDCARTNARNLGLDRVRFINSDWCEGLSEKSVDLVVSNPPYIASSDAHLDRGDLRFEPRQALVSGIDGLDDIREIAQQAKRVLRTGGWLLVEHGHDQGKAVQSCFGNGGYASVFTCRDIAGKDRVTGAQWNHEPH